MANALKYNINGEKIGEVALPASVFEASCNNPKALLYEVVNMYLANQRQGTKATKSRGLVSGSTKKLGKQKGSGNARMGSRRSPVRVGGGHAFRIDPKCWYKHIPAKKKRLALKLALTDRAAEGNIFVVENLNYDKPSTKTAKQLIEKIITEKGKVLVVTKGNNIPVVKSFTNLEHVMTDRANGLNAYGVLKSTFVVMTEEALQQVEEVFGK
jgi:large subunit ribosomal protein L4